MRVAEDAGYFTLGPGNATSTTRHAARSPEASFTNATSLPVVYVMPLASAMMSAIRSPGCIVRKDLQPLNLASCAAGDADSILSQPLDIVNLPESFSYHSLDAVYGLSEFRCPAESSCDLPFAQKFLAFRIGVIASIVGTLANASLWKRKIQ